MEEIIVENFDRLWMNGKRRNSFISFLVDSVVSQHSILNLIILRFVGDFDFLLVSSRLSSTQFGVFQFPIKFDFFLLFVRLCRLGKHSQIANRSSIWNLLRFKHNNTEMIEQATIIVELYSTVVDVAVSLFHVLRVPSTFFHCSIRPMLDILLAVQS